MARQFQPYFYTLRTPQFAAGGQDAVSLEALPTKIFGRIAHLQGILINYVVTPTLTTSPTTPAQTHSLIKSMVFYDGIAERFNASFYDLRQFEIMENGFLQTPDPALTGTGVQVRVSRYLPMGPVAYEGNPTDFLLPVAALRSGEIRLNFGALTDWSADTTVFGAVNIQLVAVLVPLDGEIRLPPAFERRTFNYGSSEAQVQGQALYTSLGIAKQSNAAFTAGDLLSVSWDSGLGQAPTAETSSLTTLAQYFLRSSVIGQLAGEPRGAADTNLRTVNLATPTALQPADFALQAVIMSPENARISKIIADSQSSMRIKWTGSLTTPKLLVSRILRQPQSASAAYAGRAAQSLGLKMGATRVKTSDKTDYNGPRQEYMPLSMKLS